jgi:hypothetical protein
LLTAHAAIGSLVLLLAVAALFVRWARRATLYALIVQIVVGAIVSGALKLPPPALHALLALLVGGVYAMANAFERKGRSPVLVRGLLVLGVLMLAAAYYIGEHALRA